MRTHPLTEAIRVALRGPHWWPAALFDRMALQWRLDGWARHA